MSDDVFVGKLEKEGDVAYVWCPFCKASCITELIEKRDGEYLLKCKMCENEHKTSEPKYYIEVK